MISLWLRSKCLCECVWYDYVFAFSLITKWPLCCVHIWQFYPIPIFSTCSNNYVVIYFFPINVIITSNHVTMSGSWASFYIYHNQWTLIHVSNSSYTSIYGQTLKFFFLPKHFHQFNYETYMSPLEVSKLFSTLGMCLQILEELNVESKNNI